MTIAELIARLQTLDPKLRVVVNEYEMGYTELRTVKIIRAHQWVPPRNSGFSSEDRPEYDGEFQAMYQDLPHEEFVYFPRQCNL